MPPPERDHPMLRPDPVDTSIWSADVAMSDRHWWEDNVGGWGNDPRSLRRRVAETLADGALRIAAALVVMFVIFWLFG